MPMRAKMGYVIAQGRAFCSECTHRVLAYPLNRDRAEHFKDTPFKRRLVSVFEFFLKPFVVVVIVNPAKYP